jgi:hypothetical protein
MPDVDTTDKTYTTQDQSAEEQKVYTDEQKISAEDPNTPRGKIISAITKIGEYLKIPILSVLNCTAFFVVVYLTGWVLNAIYPNIHFDLTSLRDFYLMVIGKQTLEHSVNSVFNSNKGAMPFMKQDGG